MSQDILVEQRDGIATVTFNRPEQRNAINYSMWLDLHRISVDLETARRRARRGLPRGWR